LQRSRTKEQEEVCSLTYSLTRFFKVEELADSELYFCDNCMGKQRSTKRFWIHRLPNVSIVSFKTMHSIKIKFELTFYFQEISVQRNSYFSGKKKKKIKILNFKNLLCTSISLP